MMKKYSKGGGADTGTVGEEKSKFGVATNKARRFIKKDHSFFRAGLQKINN